MNEPKAVDQERDEFQVAVRIRVNGKQTAAVIDSSLSLLDYVRECGMTGTHSGCEQGVCGACTVLIDGEPARACIVLAAQVSDGPDIETVEGIGSADEPSDLQVAFSQSAGLQCGFCTPGFLMLATGMLRHDPRPNEETIREIVSSNLCRCTGYQTIADSIRTVAGGSRP